jgi:hypothetical protein
MTGDPGDFAKFENRRYGTGGDALRRLRLGTFALVFAYLLRRGGKAGLTSLRFPSAPSGRRAAIGSKADVPVRVCRLTNVAIGTLRGMTFLRIVIPLSLLWSMIFSENRCPFFGIMLSP